MRPDLWRRVSEWQGVAFAAVVIVATLWLAATSRLNLYIHPRYIVFTVIMAVIGLAFVIAACAHRLVDTAHEHEHEHEHEHDDPDKSGPLPGSRVRTRRALSIVGVSVTAVLALGLIVVPPATLTSATAGQRAINSTAVDATTSRLATDASATSAAAFEKFTVLDWASVLRQTSDLAFYADKPARVVGFVTPDSQDPENMFYVSRFIVTCCAVDAQPVGVPVYLEGWSATYSADEWVAVAGEFAANPSRTSRQNIVLEPADIKKVGQPDDPYLY